MSSTLDKILLKLSKVQKSRLGGYVACCPAHDDHSPSFSIKEEPNGKILFYCYTGCSFEAILHALNLTPQDINPAANQPQTTRYEVRDLEGNLISSHTRRDTPEGKQVFWSPPLKPMGLSLPEMPFYRSQDIVHFDPTRWVYLTEGEKCCDLLRANFGVQAVGTVTGAASQHNAQVFATLKGLKVALWPDNDAIGYAHMQKAHALVTTVGAAQVVMLNPREMGLSREGDDAEQWIEAQRKTYSHQELAQLLETCQFPKVQAPKEVPPTQTPPPDEEQTFVSLESLLPVSLLRLEKRATGEEKPVPLPFPHVAQSFGGGLWAGAHYIVGTTGSGKTQIALEFAKYAAIQGYPTLFIALELGEMDLVSRLVTPLPYRWSETFLGKLPTAAWPDLVNKANSMKAWPLYFEFGDPRGWPYTRLLRSVEQLRQKHPDGPLLVVLDFLQLVGDESLTNPRVRPLEPRARVGNAAYLARQCAKNYGASMLILSSTARNNYQQLAASDLPEGLASDGRVTEPGKFIGTAKESGDVEFSGDTVTAIVKSPLSLEKERYLLVTAKSRYGAPRWAELHFDGSNFFLPDIGNSLETALRTKEAASKGGTNHDF